MNEILIQIFLGAIQGIAEWLPASSSGTLTLTMSNFFGITEIETLLRSILLLHLGTFFAVLIYFRKDVWDLTKSLFNYRSAHPETKKILNFLFISTLISGAISFLILKLLETWESHLLLTGRTITFCVGFLLLITGLLQVKIKNKGIKRPIHLEKNDGVLLGVAQGLASLPGLSRSGITVSALLLKKFDDTTALRLSFLMSLPIVLIGNLVLNFKEFSFHNTAIYGILSSFFFGIITIHILMKISRKINFGWFVLLFSFLMMASAFVF